MEKLIDCIWKNSSSLWGDKRQKTGREAGKCTEGDTWRKGTSGDTKTMDRVEGGWLW